MDIKSENRDLYIELEKLLGGDETARLFRVWARNLIKKTLAKRTEKANDERSLDEATLIINDLNKRAGSHFRAVGETLRLINARLAEGYAVEDFYKVHEVKCAEWLPSETMRGSLKPGTLYRPCHFGDYLGQWGMGAKASEERREKREERFAVKPEPASEEIKIELPTLTAEQIQEFVRSISGNIALLALWRKSRLESAVIKYAVREWLKKREG